MSDDELFDETVEPRGKIDGKKYHRMFNWLTNQVVTNFAPVVVVSGKEGKGKSMAALEIARIMHNEIGVCKGDFDPQRNLCYDVIEFLKLIRDSERNVIILDEAGVNLNSKKWWSDFNRAVDETIQTMRYKSNIYLFVLPKVKDLDKSIRERIDFRLEMKSKGVADVTWYQYNFGKMDGENKKDRETHYLEQLVLPKPPEDLRKRYREKEMAFKEGNTSQWIEDLLREEEAEEQNKGKIRAG